MNNFTLQSAADKIIRDCLLVKNNEQVIIVSDDAQDESVYHCLLQSATIYGGEASLILFPTSKEIPGQRVNMPRSVISAADTADVVIFCGSRVPSWEIYSHAADGLTKARILLMTGMTPEGIIRNTMIDFDEMDSHTEKLLKEIINTKKVEITCPCGTNIELDIEGCSSNVANGRFGQKNPLLISPASLEFYPPGRIGTFLNPNRKVNGLICMQSFLGLGLVGGYIELEIEKSRIVNVRGINTDNWYINAFRKLINLDSEANNFIEFGIGTNKASRLNGTFEDYGVEGVVRFGFGESRSVGIDSIFHSDGFTLGATVKFDGKLFIENGNLVFPS